MSDHPSKETDPLLHDGKEGLRLFANNRSSSSSFPKLTPRSWRDTLTDFEEYRQSSSQPPSQQDFDLLYREKSKRRFSRLLSTFWRSSANHAASQRDSGGSPTESGDTLLDDDKVVVDFLPANIHKSSWRNKIAFYLDSSSAGRSWELFDALVNFCFCALYIWNTTFVDQGLPIFNRFADFILALILLGQYIPKLFIAVDLKLTILSPMTSLTLISSIPVFFAFNDYSLNETYLSAGGFAFVYPFRFLRLHFSFMAIMAPAKTAFLKLSLISRKAIRLLGFLLFMVLTVAAFVHMVAFKLQRATKLTFFDSFFFAIVSGTSGSTAQIVPDGPFSRLVILYVMITGAIFIPKNLAELLTLINKRSPYVHSFKKKYQQNHVVVCGQFENYTLKTFLKEFFCPDHGSSTVNTHVVILNPKEPDEDLKEILEDPLYLNRVWYVKGSTLDPRSLEKVRICDASAGFIFSTKHATNDASIDDSETVMRALALKKHVRDLQLHVQVLLPENKCHFDYLAESMVCVEELKLGVLSQNCRCPGFTTLMYHLTTSLTDKKKKEITSTLAQNVSKDWIREYLDGASQEIYPTVLSQSLAGYTFCEVSAMIYQNFAAVLIGIGIPNKYFYQRLQKNELNRRFNPDTEDDERRFHATDFDLHLNPPHYVVRGGEIAFVITRHDKVAKWIADFKPHEVKEFMSLKPDATFFKRWRDRLSGKPSDLSRQRQSEWEPSSSFADQSFQTSASHMEKNPFGPSTDVRRLLQAPSSESLQSHSKFVIPKTTVIRNELVPNDIFGTGAAEPITSSEGPSHLTEHEQHEQGFVSRILQNAIGFNLYEADESSRKRASTASSSQTDLYEKTSYCKVIPDTVSGHILLCDASDSFPSNLEYFIAPLRAPHLYEDTSKWSSIVVLSPAEPMEHQRKMLDRFEGVYIVQGSPLRRRDLARAGVTRCEKAVILANASVGKKNPERTSDASVLLIVMNVEAMAAHEDVFIVTEFVHTENMQFIGESNLSVGKPGKNQEYKTLMRPAFMAGHVYAQSMLDTVICQSYYNPHLLNIMRHLIFSGIFHEFNLKCDEQVLPLLAADLKRHSSAEMLRQPLPVYKDEENASSLPRIHEQKRKTPPAHHSHIWLIPLPAVLAGTCYGDLYAYAARDMYTVILGLYRRAPANMRESVIIGEDITDDDPDDSGNFAHHYVHINPNPGILLREDDQVYVLSPNSPKWTDSY